MGFQRSHGGELGTRLLEVPAERVIASARLVLAIVALIAIYLDPTQPARYVDATYLILLCYLAYAATVFFWTAYTGRIKAPLAFATHLIDLGTIAVVMEFTEGPTSPFFVLLTFILLAAALRWEWLGVVSTALALFLLLLLLALSAGLPGTGEDLNRFILRGAYLLVAGAMLAYVGAFRTRSRARFAKLASWPATGMTSNSKPSFAAPLEHAAEALNASRMLCVWEYPGEPRRHSWSWEDGQSEYTYEPAVAPICDLVPEIDKAALIEKNGTCLISDGRDPKRFSHVAISPWLKDKCRSAPTAIAPFRNATCSGYLFAFDCRNCDDLLSLTSIIAFRFGIEIEHDWLQQQMQTAAAERERSRLARDVHDGVIQALTASALSLKVCAKNVDQRVRGELDAIRIMLAQEQKRLRELVSDVRSESLSRNIPLSTDINRLVADLRAFWRCEIPLEIKPDDAEISADIAGHLHLIIAEAVANATKHGSATRVTINLERFAEILSLHIHDNGRGFSGLTGTYESKALSELKIGPRSICERVNELGGGVTLSTSSAGSQLNLQLPMR